MYEVKEHLKGKVILVTVSLRQDRLRGWDADDSAKELRDLALTSGVNIVDEIICKRDELTPNYLIGKGKAEEIQELIHAHHEEIDAALFSENLSSTQQKHLEDILGVKTIDRTQLILDIFAQRAHSNEGKLQVELAQLEYLSPRLAGKGIMLSRLGGGIGTRGPGEQKLEVDRRRIKERIAKIKDEIESVRFRRGQLRKKRIEHSVATIAIIGYTNAGKSTLLNSLTEAKISVDDKLFSTLDPTSRQYILPNNQKVLFVDTVGFIRHLPHNLIEAFKATLEEVREADLLLHVVDINNPKANEQIDAVYEVLKELDALEKPIATALNKVDLIDGPHLIERFRNEPSKLSLSSLALRNKPSKLSLSSLALRNKPSKLSLSSLALRNKLTAAIAISALKGTGFDGLIDVITGKLNALVRTVELFIPHSKMSLVGRIYEEGKVIERKDTAQGVHLKAIIPVKMKFKL